MARPAACRGQIRKINLSPGNRETMGEQVRVNMARRFSASHLKTVRDLRQQELTSSFVHLSFVFAGESAKDRTIEMPFALLSPMLASPIVVLRHLTSQAKPVDPVQNFCRTSRSLEGRSGTAYRMVWISKRLMSILRVVHRPGPGRSVPRPFGTNSDIPCLDPQNHSQRVLKTSQVHCTYFAKIETL